MILFFSLFVSSLFLSLVNGFECGNDSLVEYNSNGIPKKFPWSVLLRIKQYNGIAYCSGIIVSPTHIVTYECGIDHVHQLTIYANRRKFILDVMDIDVYQFATLKIKNPDWKRVDSFIIFTLDQPLTVNKKHAPICLSDGIPKEKLSDLVYFDWKANYARDITDFSWASVIGLIVRKIPEHQLKEVEFKSAISYLENGKWYLAGIRKNDKKHDSVFYKMSKLINEIKQKINQIITKYIV